MYTEITQRRVSADVIYRYSESSFYTLIEDLPKVRVQSQHPTGIQNHYAIYVMASMLTQHGRFHVANGDYDDDDDICGSVRTSKPKEISRSVRPKYRITTSQRPMEKSTQA